METKVLTVTLPKEVYDDMARLADLFGITTAAMAQQALKLYFGRKKEEIRDEWGNGSERR